MATDPHVLVALASVGIGHKLRVGDNDRNLASTIDQSLITGSIINDHNTHRRTFPVLDTIASICVSSAESQVVAVALQMDHAAREIRLTLADNTAVEQRTVEHITAVWMLMMALSNINAELRLAPHPIGAGSPTVPAITLATAPHRLAMVSRIYEFSIDRIMKRFTKWWTSFKEFGDRFEVQKAEMHGEETLKDCFLDMVHWMEAVHEALQWVWAGQCILDSEWKRLLMYMNGVVRGMKDIFQMTEACGVWASALKGTVLCSASLLRF